MRPLALPILAALLLVTLGGCAAKDLGPSQYTPRTVEVELEIKPGMSDTIALYTLNDGERMMEVAAMGFSVIGEELTVPNPEIRLREGDTLILTIINNNPLPHTFHFHGGIIPWQYDGVPYFTQLPIHMGEEYTYVFENLKAGTYWYHCHVDGPHHIDLGMYGAFIVEEVEAEEVDLEFVLMLDEWDTCHVHGNLDPVVGGEQHGEAWTQAECMRRFLQDNLAQNQAGNIPRNAICMVEGLPPEVYDALDCHEHMQPPPQQARRTWWPETHPIYNPTHNVGLINGKAFPDTAPLVVKEGDLVRVRLINVGDHMHSMHIHGHSMLVTHRDGYRLEAPFRVDTLGIMPGERYDVLIRMDNPGYWPFHDHVGKWMMNDHQDPGGMFTCIAYDGFHGIDASGFTRALDCHHAAMSIFGGAHDGHQPLGMPVLSTRAAGPVATQSGGHDAASHSGTAPGHGLPGIPHGGVVGS